MKKYSLQIKKLFLIHLIIISSSTFGGEGDVYYCVSNFHVNIGGSVEYLGQLDILEFQWNEAEIVFSKESHFSSKIFRLTYSSPIDEIFDASGKFVHFQFNSGKLTYAVVIAGNVEVMHANCKKV